MRNKKYPDILYISCTKQIIVLYKRINYFVQKNAFFCTREYKLLVYNLKRMPKIDLR